MCWTCVGLVFRADSKLLIVSGLKYPILVGHELDMLDMLSYRFCIYPTAIGHIISLCHGRL